MTPNDRTRRPKAFAAVVFAAAGAVVLLAPLVLAVDLPLQRAAKSLDTPGVVDDYFAATEAFGNGFGVAMIVLAVAALDRTRRVQIGRLLITSLGAGLLADTVKLTIERARPHAAGVDELLATGATAADTFAGFFPLAAAGNVGQSFPSAHTATAFGLAVVLASFYPNGRRLFFAFALGVAMQRVCVGAHFLSDVIVGMAIGVGWGFTCCGATSVARGFDRIELWWSNRFGWPLPEGHALLVGSEEEADVLTLPERTASVPSTDARRAA